jgi:hypothetical protein
MISLILSLDERSNITEPVVINVIFQLHSRLLQTNIIERKKRSAKITMPITCVVIVTPKIFISGTSQMDAEKGSSAAYTKSGLKTVPPSMDACAQ